MKIALAGNPNSGKTTMFNALTGGNERVGNWAGVTVDKKERLIKKTLTDDRAVFAVDLPGAYSMSPFTSEESVTSDYVKNEAPDAIINIVDATNLSRSLFFTTQLLELGIPTVVALNKSDVNKKKRNTIDAKALSEKLGCPVIETVSIASDGLSELVRTALDRVGEEQSAPYTESELDRADKESMVLADRRRFEFVNGIVQAVESRTVLTKTYGVGDKIDRFLTSKWLGLPIFAIVMFLVFGISQAWLGPFIADFLASGITVVQEAVGAWFEGAHPLVYALLVDGIIGGVGAILGFLPLVMVMYFLIAILEDCGYMARVSVVLDPIFKRVGLSGKSVIPFVIGTGCAIPGVMACRTIRDENERRATAMLAPFMPCGAKLPVIALFAGVFFADSAWIGVLMYFVGIAIIFFGALVVNTIAGYKARRSFFIMELPEYKLPSIKRATLSMLSRGWSYIVKAGTVILVCNTAVQIMQNFTWRFTLVGEGEAASSILATLATPIAYLLIPLGFGMWQMAASAITGFIAKENVVATLAVCYSITNFIDVEELLLVEGASEVAAIFGITPAAALACLFFNLFTPPCFAAIGAMASELKSRKWLFGGLALQIATGYTLAFLVYQIGTLITTGSIGDGFIGGLVAVSAMLAIIAALMVRGSRSIKAKKQGKAS